MTYQWQLRPCQQNNNTDRSIVSQNEKSMMTFEGTQIPGSQILQKVKSLGVVKHTPKTMDIQPSIDGSSIVIFVTGHVAIGDPNANPLHFSEFFHLVASAPGQYYVHNDIFRLNYGL